MDLLFLAHRIPYPPNKGDKIRSWHLLRGLARDYRVHLGAFVDDPGDWRHRSELEAVCESVFLRPLDRRRARVRALVAAARGRPLSVGYFSDKHMGAWARSVLDGGATKALAFSGPMAQYLRSVRGTRRVIDFVDVDSDKWRQYAAGRSGPTAWLYGWEARALARFEQDISCMFDGSIFVSEHEATLFRNLCNGRHGPVCHIPNGVDVAYFDKDGQWPSPYPEGSIPVVFTGAMDYWANVDAVKWFCGAVLPAVRRQVPDIHFHVVGSRPTNEVRRLGTMPGVHVTGRVDDVRPYLAHAAVAVAPLRIARGIQNKVLEAMAMGRPVVMTPQAAEGLHLGPALRETIVSDAEAFARTVVDIVRSSERAAALAAAGLDYVLERHDWDDMGAKMRALLEGGTGSDMRAATAAGIA